MDAHLAKPEQSHKDIELSFDSANQRKDRHNDGASPNMPALPGAMFKIDEDNQDVNGGVAPNKRRPVIRVDDTTPMAGTGDLHTLPGGTKDGNDSMPDITDEGSTHQKYANH